MIAIPITTSHVISESFVIASPFRKCSLRFVSKVESKRRVTVPSCKPIDPTTTSVERVCSPLKIFSIDRNVLIRWVFSVFELRFHRALDRDGETSVLVIVCSFLPKESLSRETKARRRTRAMLTLIEHRSISVHIHTDERVNLLIAIRRR